MWRERGEGEGGEGGGVEEVTFCVLGTFANACKLIFLVVMVTWARRVQ